MITQQLLDFINQQIQAGVLPEQIKAGLLASGWQEVDVNQAMNALNIPVTSAQSQQPAQYSDPSSYYQPAPDYSTAQYPQYSTEATANSSKKILVIVAIVLGALLVIGGAAIAAISLSKSRQASKQSTQTTTSPTSSPPASAAAEQLAFADKLKACEKYKAKFTHILTREKMDREITGIVDNKCNYIEQMPNGGKMTCQYSQVQREAAANYYKLIASDSGSGSASTESKTDPTTGKTLTITKVDGKEVESPLTTYLSDGTCVISGYQSGSSTNSGSTTSESSSSDGD